MKNQEIKSTAMLMVSNGKGILAADESTGTITKRLNSIGVESNFNTRNEYRDLLFSTKGLSEFISGIIMYDETIRQTTTCDKKIHFGNKKYLFPS